MQKDFALKIIKWQKEFGRHNLPWQVKDPYKIWLSEIMLQQTQVESVKIYYQNFLTKFPTIQKLSAANIDEVLAAWSGLGYYARAKNLYKTAQIIVNELNGEFPKTPEALNKLPGIGKSTAAAIAVFAFGAHAAILDGNVKRVFARFFWIDDFINTAQTEKKMWALANNLLPQNEIEIYTQALMDLGAMICTPKNPKCEKCPLKENCAAYFKNAVEMLPKKQKIARQNVELKWFLLFYENKIYLEKKPLKGIWGGLFCPVEKLESEFQIKKEFLLSNFTHHLTHRILNIAPKIILLKEKPQHLKGEWFEIENALKEGLPAPLTKLLENKTIFPR